MRKMDTVRTMSRWYEFTMPENVINMSSRKFSFFEKHCLGYTIEFKPRVQKFKPRNLKELPGNSIFLKYKCSSLIEELFGYNLYKTAKKVIDFFIAP